MKKTLVLLGSPRAESDSSTLCDRLIMAEQDKSEIVFYNAYDMKALPCYACGWCEKNSGCISPDLDGFMADFESADYFVIASPVYNGGVPAPLKAIVDRFQRYYALRFAHGKKPPVDKPKRAALILTAGSKGEGKESIENMFRQQFTILNTQLIETVFVNSTDTKTVGTDEYKLAESAGKKLFEY